MVRIASAMLALTASAALASCAYGPGYGGVSVGYGGGGYYDDYGYYDGYGYYDDYGYYGYGVPYFGWYGGYYYPGVGYYIYDYDGHRHEWNDDHRRHWEGRARGRDRRENWAAFHREAGDRSNGWQGRQGGGDRAGRQDEGRRAEAQGRPDGRRRTYSDARVPEAEGESTPAPAASARSGAVAAARPDPADRAVPRTAQREQRAGNSAQQRASRSAGSGSRQTSRGGGEGRRGGRGPQD